MVSKAAGAGVDRGIAADGADAATDLVTSQYPVGPLPPLEFSVQPEAITFGLEVEKPPPPLRTFLVAGPEKSPLHSPDSGEIRTLN